MSGVHKVTGDQAVASPTDTCLGITAATTKRPKIVEATFSADATPADNALVWLLQRYTAAGTATSVTPHASDPAMPPALFSAGENHTAEPTYTSGAILDEFAVNQRASIDRVYDRYPLIAPATTANGIGAQPVHSSFTGQVKAIFQCQEE